MWQLVAELAEIDPDTGVPYPDGQVRPPDTRVPPSLSV
jgi:hypothetical protein